MLRAWHSSKRLCGVTGIRWGSGGDEVDEDKYKREEGYPVCGVTGVDLSGQVDSGVRKVINDRQKDRQTGSQLTRQTDRQTKKVDR